MSRFGKRIVRDLAAVVIFCGVFFGVVILINFLQAGAEEEEVTDFSEFRVTADAARKNKNFDVALTNLQSMVERDPFDGRARYLLARSRFSMFDELKNEIKKNATNDLSNDSQRADSALKKELQTLIDIGIAEFSEAADHPRYRENSCYFLSRLHAANNEYKKSLKFLSEFVNADRYHPKGLHTLEEFKPLLNHPKFAAIIEKESTTREKYFHRIAADFGAFNPQSMRSSSRLDSRRTAPKSRQNRALKTKASDLMRSMSIANFSNWFRNDNLISLWRKFVNFVSVRFK